MDENCELKQQKESAKKLIYKSLVVEDVWYLLSSQWFSKWKSYVNFDQKVNQEDCEINNFAKNPGPIDNSELLFQLKLQKNLAVGTDLIFIPKELWQTLYQYYGCKHQSTSEFERTVVSSLSNKLSLDLYPPKLMLINKDYKVEPIYQTFCLIDTIEDVKNCIRSKITIPEDHQICIYAEEFDDIINTDDSTTLQESSLDGERKLYYEIKEKSFANGSNGDLPSRFYSKRNSSVYPLGVCGLSNLGNTCFMNSALQCISNVPQLTAYFLSNKCDKDLNKENRLGSGGLVACAYRDLMQKMWSSSHAGSYCIPREVKSYIGKFASQFAGYQQHDAQELMSFLLDFLSEDLNRITKKPYVEYEDSNGRPDEIVAAESWSNYKKRNDSIIVDLFYGLLKSTVVCPECALVSIIFDPFALLSLSLNNIQPNIVLWPHHTEEEDEMKCISYTPYMHPSYTCADVIAYFKKIRPLRHDFQYVVAKRSTDESLHILDPSDKQHLKMTSLAVFELKTGSIVRVEIQAECSKTIKSFLVSCPLGDQFLNSEQMITVVRQHLTSYFGTKIANHILQKPELDNCDDHIKTDDVRLVRIIVAQLQPLNDLLRTVPPHHLHLTECLDFFTYSETLSEKNSWYCSKCKKHCQASKKFDIWKLPTVLVIHLKRYKTMFRINKNEVFVDCPKENLEIVNLKGEKTVYNLAAVSNHMGGMGGGHYTATAKNNETWYNFDDSSVSIAHDPIVTRNAYILIYIRRDADKLSVLSNGDAYVMHQNSD